MQCGQLAPDARPVLCELQTVCATQSASYDADVTLMQHSRKGAAPAIS